MSPATSTAEHCSTYPGIMRAEGPRHVPPWAPRSDLGGCILLTSHMAPPCLHSCCVSSALGLEFIASIAHVPSRSSCHVSILGLVWIVRS
ncbi:hypothetical protein FIBSPDRAFT_856106 [Athelia psychrophila]|uniref:Uncharacterized protein n=1 Tax=Athelia psychrophila TaxID=1759441 RepID=A0A166NM26_9AGAM|nr:hypothetical protein FIBSPDRAFT_856106 [Fibularhizoctonia sp. CBS 109695]